jgi:hypothetical protein
LKAIHTFLLLFIAALGFTSCREAKDVASNGTDCVLWSVQIVMLMPNDTLQSSPGNSASAQGFVSVYNDMGSSIPHVIVNVSVREPDYGYIEYADSTLRDTTNELGRVYFRVRTSADSCRITIHAESGGAEDNHTLWVLPATTPVPRARILIEPDTLFIAGPWSYDSVRIEACICDTSSHSIPGIWPAIGTGCGSLGNIHPLDSDGFVILSWYLGACSAGRHWFRL